MVLIKTDDKVLKKRHPANHIKMYTELCGKTYLSRKSVSSKLDGYRVQIHGYQAPIANLDVNAIPTLPIQTQCMGQCRFENTVEGA